MKAMRRWILPILSLLLMTGCQPGGMHPPVEAGDVVFHFKVFVHKKDGTDRAVAVIPYVNVTTSDFRPFYTPFDDVAVTPWGYTIIIPADVHGLTDIQANAGWVHIQNFGEVGDVFGCELIPESLGHRVANSRGVGNSGVSKLTVDCNFKITL